MARGSCRLLFSAVVEGQDDKKNNPSPAHKKCQKLGFLFLQATSPELLMTKHTAKSVKQFFFSCPPPPPAVHPDYHADHLHEPECIRGPRDALHAQSLRHHLPPGAQRAEEETLLQSSRHSRHHVVATLPQSQRQTQRGGQDGAVRERRPQQ